MAKRLALILALSLVVTSTRGQAPSAEDYRSAAAPGEGQTLDVVQVGVGEGDGRVTERDALALSEYCIWGFNQVLAANHVELELKRDAEDRMLEFWVYVWDHVDLETKAVISQADVIWPQIREQLRDGGEQVRLAHAQQFFGIMAEIWGGLEIPTVQYLAGMLAPQAYSEILNAAIAQEQARAQRSSGGGGGDGGLSGWEPTVDYDPTATLETTTFTDGGMTYSDPN